MSQVQEILVDPFLLCLPNPCTTSEQLEDFVNSLVGWRGLTKRENTHVLLSDSSQVALHDDNEYPHRHRLSQLLKQFQCDIADEKTISKLVSGILAKTPSFEDYYGIDAVLIDEDGMSVDPTTILSRLKVKCRSAFAQTLATISIVRLIKTSETVDSVLIASAFGTPSISPQPEEVVFESEIHQVDFLQKDVDFSAELPLKVVTAIPISFDHNELLNRLGLWGVWNNASDKISISTTILMCVQSLINSGVSEDLKVEFTLGDAFLDSVKACGAGARSDYAMVIIESCARIVLGIPKNPIIEFRVDAKPTSAQRTRDDGSLAFRTHLTKKGEGLRLMVWRLPNGVFEFANVGNKDDLRIL